MEGWKASMACTSLEKEFTCIGYTRGEEISRGGEKRKKEHGEEDKEERMGAGLLQFTP